MRSACRHGGKTSLKNFSKDYPVKLHEQTDENIIAEQVVEVLNDESKLQSVFEVFFTSMEKPLEDALLAQAASLGKTIQELTDDDIMQAAVKIDREIGGTNAQMPEPEPPKAKW